MGAHLIDGEFQSDKYPTTPRGKVPLSVKDPTAQDLLWEYAQRRRAVDAEFSDDLEAALRTAGYGRQSVPDPTQALQTEVARLTGLLKREQGRFSKALSAFELTKQLFATMDTEPVYCRATLEQIAHVQLLAKSRDNLPLEFEYATGHIICVNRHREWRWYRNDELHREDGPAIQSRFYEAWFWDGLGHRGGGPAFIRTGGSPHTMHQARREGSLLAQSWLCQGELHREDGPAVEYRDAALNEWWTHGERRRADGTPWPGGDFPDKRNDRRFPPSHPRTDAKRPIPYIGDEFGNDQSALHEDPLNKQLFRSVDELGLSFRSTHCLQSAHISLIGELVQKTEQDLLKTKRFGRKSIREIAKLLITIDLHLGMRLDHWPEMLKRWKQQQESQ